MKKDDKAKRFEVESLNEGLLPLDLENPDVEELEQRLELAVASLPIGVEEECFTCVGFACKTFEPPPP